MRLQPRMGKAWRGEQCERGVLCYLTCDGADVRLRVSPDPSCTSICEATLTVPLRPHDVCHATFYVPVLEVIAVCSSVEHFDTKDGRRVLCTLSYECISGDVFLEQGLPMCVACLSRMVVLPCWPSFFVTVVPRTTLCCRYRVPELREFCAEHGLVLTSIQDLRCLIRERQRAGVLGGAAGADTTSSWLAR